MEDLDSMKEKPKENNERSWGVEDEKGQNLYQMLDNNHRFIRARARMFPGWSTCHSASWVSRSPYKPVSTPTEDISASSTLYGSEGFRKRFQTRDNLYEDQTEYEIDPITNRKVPRKPNKPVNESSKPVDIPVKTSKGYRSQFKTFEPSEVQSDKAETPSKIPASQDHSNGVSSHAQEMPVTNVQSREVDPLKKYDEKIGYNSGRHYNTAEMDIDYSCPVQNGLKAFDDKVSSTTTAKTPVEENISPQKKSNQDGLETYDKKATYEGRQYFGSAYDEIDQVDPVQEAIRTYHSSKGLKHSRVVHPRKRDDEDRVMQARREYEDSDARRAYTQDQEASRLLQSIQNYEEIMAAERATGHVSGASGHEQLHPLLKAIREYEASELDKKTDPHEGAAHGQSDPVLRALREYKSLVSHVEASDKRTARQIEKEAVDPLLSAINEYEALVQSSSVLPGERADSSVEDCLKKYDAKVNFYRKPYQAEENSLGESESKPGRYNIELNLSDANAERLSRLRASYFMKADELTITPKSWAHLPQKIRDLFARQAKSDSKRWDQATIDRKGRQAPSRELRETEEAKKARRKELEHDFTATKVPGVSSEDLENARRRAVELRYEHNRLRNDATHIEGLVGAKLGKLENESQPENQSKKMTGNFVRDFPEEFETTWTRADGSSGGLTHKNKSDREIEVGAQQGEYAYVNGLGSQEAFSGRPDVERLEPSLNRAISRNAEPNAAEKNDSQMKVGSAQQGEGDLSELMSVETGAHTIKQQLQKEKNAQKELDRELVREVRSIHEDAYETITAKHRQIPSASQENGAISEVTPVLDAVAVTAPPPTVYKILAYDPTMQSISTAETTSIVSDASGPLTPAEVLLRLSNPAKFFPYFAPLQKQGYEIVSGSGDVLVFRKFREGSPPGVEKTSTTAAIEEKRPEERKRNDVNPIDGMTRGPIAAIGDFASPTGFVNHDIPRGSEPPFKSNIDVRREEPVFSGKRNWEDKEESGRKKRGVTKTVLVGAGWLGACSYAIGVVADYFKTGGADGKGPKGF